MANITITVPDSVLPDAKGAFLDDEGATNAALKQAVVDNIKDIIVSYRRSKVQATEEAKIETAKSDLQTAVEAETTLADSEVNIT